jgi:hypothetical protein
VLHKVYLMKVVVDEQLSNLKAGMDGYGEERFNVEVVCSYTPIKHWCND